MYQIDFNHPSSIYFVGIGGISMSGLAEILADAGFRVSGSDRSKSPLTETLERKGITVFYGQRAANITDDIDCVVFTSAIHKDNPEYIATMEKGIPYLTRAQLLGEIMQNYKTPIAISGTHGKTTTTSMVSEILLHAGTDPTLSIGGMLKSIGGNIRVGSTDLFVTEACEYTNSSVPIGCNSTSSCYDDYGYKRYSSKCTGSCWTGYTKDSSGECVQSCHYSERWSMDGCTNEDSCTIQTNSSGSTTTYYAGTCSSCYVGYSNSGGGCSQTCYSNSNTSHCVSSEQCQLGSASGTSTNTLCLTCEDGYYSSQGYCHDCSGMVPGRTGLTTEPSCSSSEEKKSYPCGNKTYYYCTSK